MFGLIFESFIALLLVVTIGYCWRLSKRITLLHKSRQELNKFIQDFNTAIARAEHNIEELKVLGKEADVSLASHIEQAKYLTNDLSFLMEKGETVADNLEQQLEVARDMKPSHAALQPRPPRRTPLPAVPRRAPAAEPALATTPDIRAREIEQILTTGVLPPHMKPEQPRAEQAIPSQAAPSKKQAVDTVLAQIALHKAAITKPVPQAAPQTAPAPRPAPASIPAAAPIPGPTFSAAPDPAPTTATRLNETIDRVFNKKRLEQVRERVEK